MSRVKGSAKTGGRQKGTPNKITSAIKERIVSFLDDYTSTGLLDSDMAALKPVERIMMAEKLMQYAMPKMQAIQAEVTHEDTKTIEDKLIELSKVK